MWILPQIVYDEGPLYIFAKTDDIRAQWIKKLKECEYMHADLHIYLLCMYVPCLSQYLTLSLPQQTISKHCAEREEKKCSIRMQMPNIM